MPRRALMRGSNRDLLRRRLGLTVGSGLVGALVGYGLGSLGLTVGVGMLTVLLAGTALILLYVRSTTPSVSASVRRDGGVSAYLHGEFTSTNPERLLFIGLGLFVSGGIGVAVSLSF